MKHLFLFAMVTAAGCVLDEPDAELDSVEEAIVNGASRSPQTFGVAQVFTTCSATLISNEIALTTVACPFVGASVTTGPSSSSVRSVRVPRIAFGNDAEIVAIQLQKPLELTVRGGLSSTGFAREVDKTPLKQGESVACFGFSDKKLRTGFFDVIDGSTNRLYKLRGRIDAASGNRWQVSAQDLGGFCQRDGGGIAAILSVRTGAGDIAQAIPVHDLGPGLVDMEIAKEASRGGVAIRLRDDEQQRFLTANANLNIVTAAPSHDPATQAFYFDKLANPPGSGEWYRLIDARSGRCLTVSSSSFLTQRSCTTGNLDQSFFLEHMQVNGLDRYAVLGQGGRIDADGAFVEIRPNDFTGSQRFEMWLTQL